VFGLLDSGADETKLPMELGQDLGIVVDPQHPASFKGVGGQAHGFYGKDPHFELRLGKRSYAWTVPWIALLYDPIDATDDERITITLGQIGFFRYFTVTFDNQRFRVEVRPNGLYCHTPFTRR
jgi:hypothetical protein